MPNASSSSKEVISRLKLIAELLAALTAIALFIYALPKAFETAKSNIAFTVLILLGFVWLTLFFVYRSKKKSKLATRTEYRFERWRTLALIGMILILIGAPIGFAIADYIERRPSNKFLVLVADFQGPEQKHRVTSVVINRLKRATAEFPEVEVKALKAELTEQDGSDKAREKGRDEKASILIWGFYDEALNGTVHIELLSEQNQLPNSHSLSNNEEQIDYSASVGSNPGLIVKENMAGDMSLITLLLLGSIRYETADYKGAILRFSKALEQNTSLQMVEYQVSLLVYVVILFISRKILI